MDDYNNGYPIAAPEMAEVTDGQTVIAVVVDDRTLCSSLEQVEIHIRVEARPVVDISGYEGTVICVDLDPVATPTEGGGPESITLDTGLPSGGYEFTWELDGGLLEGEEGPSIEAGVAGTYTVTVKNAGGECESSSSATIAERNPPEFTVTPTRPPFSGDQGVAIGQVTGQGDYEFKIDNGPWLPLGPGGELTFDHLKPGEHWVYGRDQGGCGVTVVPINLIDYPDFFTPNADGHNDTWNVVGLEDQPGAELYIFDRYGKLLKQISPAGPGWDGTYNGKPMPSNDYWFRLKYTAMDLEGSHPAEATGHFTLKR